MQYSILSAESFPLYRQREGRIARNLTSCAVRFDVCGGSGLAVAGRRTLGILSDDNLFENLGTLSLLPKSRQI